MIFAVSDEGHVFRALRYRPAKVAISTPAMIWALTVKSAFAGMPLQKMARKCLKRLPEKRAEYRRRLSC
jgi:uncharacterized protein VirK/YbjX